MRPCSYRHIGFVKMMQCSALGKQPHSFPPKRDCGHRTPNPVCGTVVVRAVHWGMKIMRKPTFFVVRDAADWSVDAEWPDGTIERVKTFKAELAALDWLSWQSHAWLEWRGTDFGGAS
jgi:hypothetical protein